MSRHELTPGGASGLLEIIRYNKVTWGEAHAERYREELELAVQQLALSPEMAHARPAVSSGLRSFPVARHIAFRIQRKGKIVILRVLHPRMNADEAFDGR